jgi:hypothetical protein
MIINHTKKYVYVRVPKTGSTSFETQLIEDTSNDDVVHTNVPFCKIQSKNWDISSQQENFQFTVNKSHLTYSQILQLINFDISTYEIYGVLRNPVDRFLSQAYHNEYAQHDDDKFTIRPANITLTNNQLVEKWLPFVTNNFDVNTHIFKPQTDWLLHDNQPINNIFLYEDLSLLMQKLTGDSVLRYNYRNQARENKNYDDLDQGLKQELIQLYQADHDLYTSLKNKTI